MNIVPLSLVDNGTGTEEGTDLHNGVDYQMWQSTYQPKGSHNDRTKEDVGQVTDGGVSKSPLNVGFFYRTAAAVYDRKHDNEHNRSLRPGSSEKVRSEAIISQADNGEGTGFNDCNRMEQCRNRSGSHTGLRQPGVKGTDCSFHAKAHKGYHIYEQ